MARESDVNAVIGERLVVGSGGSFGLLVTPYQGEVASILKYFTGGSLEIVAAPPGPSLPNYPGSTVVGGTWLGASLNALAGTGYMFGTSETLNITGPARYYLIATGATTTVMHFVGRSQGF